MPWRSNCPSRARVWPAGLNQSACAGASGPLDPVNRPVSARLDESSRASTGQVGIPPQRGTRRDAPQTQAARRTSEREKAGIVCNENPLTPARRSAGAGLEPATSSLKGITIDHSARFQAKSLATALRALATELPRQKVPRTRRDGHQLDPAHHRKVRKKRRPSTTRHRALDLLPAAAPRMPRNRSTGYSRVRVRAEKVVGTASRVRDRRINGVANRARKWRAWVAILANQARRSRRDA